MDTSTVFPGATVSLAADSGGATYNDKAVRFSYIVIGTIGFCGNLIVVTIMLSSKTMRQSTSTLYLVSQCLLDLMAAFFVATMGIVNSDPGEENMTGVADMLKCKIWLSRMPLWAFLSSSTYNLLALSIERYLRVVHPVIHRNHFTRSRVWISIVCAWLFGPIYISAWSFPTSVLQDGRCLALAVWVTDMAASAVGVITVILQYILPLVVMVYTYTRMFLVIRAKVKVTPAANNQGQGKENQGQVSNNFQKAKYNIIKTLVIVCLCFVLCWTWNCMYFLLYFVGYPVSFQSGFYHFTVIAVFCNSCLNPLVYALNYSEFQQAAKSLVCRRNKVQSIKEITTRTTH